MRFVGATENATWHRETIEIVEADIARLDNSAPYRKGGHRETCLIVRVEAQVKSNWFLLRSNYPSRAALLRAPLFNRAIWSSAVLSGLAILAPHVREVSVHKAKAKSNIFIAIIAFIASNVLGGVQARAY